MTNWLITGSPKNLIYGLIIKLLFTNITRKYLVRYFHKVITSYLDPEKETFSSTRSHKIRNEQKLMALAIIESMTRSIDKRMLSPNVARAILELWAKALLVPRHKNSEVRKFYQENGCNPPWFLVISPGHGCNLKCTDCYASSDIAGAKLQWGIMERIINDARKLWNIKLVAFSGGEPFAYHSEGKNILDIVEQHPECLFLAFTNGTLINDEIALRIAKLKNITLAFSVEGMRFTTDQRRGQGTFDMVLNGIELMRKGGIPFGISATVNQNNYLEVLSDEFLDFFFDNQGAFYGFYFQYLPIGRNTCFDLMPTPKQRVEFWRKVWKIIEQRKLFLIDFWNHGSLAEGCISAGRDGGYLYIDWNGKVMPCVFAPYSVGNIHNVYQNCETLNHLWKSPLLKLIREWQVGYGYGNTQPTAEGNWLRPCPYRDHHGQFLNWLNRFEPEPEDASAKEVLSDTNYHQKMIKYDEELANLFDPIWKQEYLKK